MNYTKLEIENFNQKDKRIAFLSILSSLLEGSEVKISMGGIEKLAYEMTDRLFKNYPILNELSQSTTSQEKLTTAPIRAINSDKEWTCADGHKVKGTRCLHIDHYADEEDRERQVGKVGDDEVLVADDNKNPKVIKKLELTPF